MVQRVFAAAKVNRRWEYEAVSRPDQRPPSLLQMMNGRNLASGSAEKRRFINRQGGYFTSVFHTFNVCFQASRVRIVCRDRDGSGLAKARILGLPVILK